MYKMLPLLGLFLCSFSFAFDVKSLANNKESISKALSDNDVYDAREWMNTHALGRETLKLSSEKLLQTSIDTFQNRDFVCDLGLQDIIQKNAISQKIIKTNEEFKVFISYLRSENIIDDLFFKILEDSWVIGQRLDRELENNAHRPLNLHTNDNNEVDVKKLYANFSNYPDDVTSCSISKYFGIANSLSAKNPKDLSRQLKRLNYLAYEDEVISLATYNKLEILRDEEALKWPVYVNRYFDVAGSAKDKMVIGNISTTSTNSFSTKYASRKEKLTERGRLYKYFDSTQIIMLAQLVEKAGKRRDAYSAILTFQYTEESSESENYVLSPLEKYRASIKMLRNDMAALMRSENFKGVGIEYEDLISAAYETGLIKGEELDHILKFEEMWNPKTPKWKAYANFAFSIAGTAAFYLPPPFNFIGAIALVFTQTKIGGGKKDPNPENSWNIII